MGKQVYPKMTSRTLVYVLAFAVALLSVALCLVLAPGAAQAETTDVTKDGVTYTLYDAEESGGVHAVVTGKEDGVTNVDIPDSVKEGETTYPVTSIKESAFWWSDVVSVSIPASIVTIGEDAFRYSETLTTVSFAEGSQCATIGGRAFDSAGITSIDIPASVAAIGEGAFCSSKLQEVKFSDGSALQTIGDHVFEYTELAQVVIPTSITTIGENAFGNSKLVRVTFASDARLQKIGTSAFADCTSLSTIAIPASVTSIGESAFGGCVVLKSATFADGSVCKSIGKSAFERTYLINVTIPASVTDIGAYAFKDCEHLKSVTFVKDAACDMVGVEAFYGIAEGSIIYVTSTALHDVLEGTYDTDRTKVVVNDPSITQIAQPQALGGTYIGSSIALAAAGTGYTLSSTSTGVTFDTTGNAMATGAGTYTLTATLADKYAWEGGSLNPYTFNVTIAKAGLIATYAGETVQVGATPKLAVSVTGFVGTDTPATARGYVAPTVTGASTKTVGDFKLSPSGGQASDYQFTYVPGTLHVTAISVARPTALGGTYTGKAIVLAKANAGYTLTVSTGGSIDKLGRAIATNAGTYTVKATLKSGYAWSNGATTAYSFKATISPATQKLTVPAKATRAVTYSPTKAQVLKTPGVSGAKTSVSWSLAKKVAGFSINTKTGAVTVAKGTKAGKYTLTAVASAKAGNYKAASAKCVITVTVKKATQTATATYAAKTFTTAKLKKAAQVVSPTIKNKKESAKVTYKVATKDSKGKLSLNAKTGKVTVKKGTAKGTYKMRVAATFAATTNYAKAVKYAWVTVKVK